MKTIICLTCGTQFKTEQEAIDHNEHWLARERDTAHYAYTKEANKLERRHIVQISGVAG